MPSCGLLWHCITNSSNLNTQLGRKAVAEHKVAWRCHPSTATESARALHSGILASHPDGSCGTPLAGHRARKDILNILRSYRTILQHGLTKLAAPAPGHQPPGTAGSNSNDAAPDKGTSGATYKGAVPRQQIGWLVSSKPAGKLGAEGAPGTTTLLR